MVQPSSHNMPSPMGSPHSGPYIDAKQLKLYDVFSPKYEYHIPDYQRPYAWETEHAEELIRDLVDAATDSNVSEGYFLGCLLLIKSEESPIARVVDGQQRLTTLTILLSLLANKLEGDERDEVMELIIQKGRKLRKLAHNPRLTLREQDKEFFLNTFQSGKVAGLAGLTKSDFENESQAQMHANAQHLDKLIEELIVNKENLTVSTFAEFLMNNCYMVSVSTPKEEAAFRLFEVLNNRGMQLQNSDIIKADVIRKIDDARKKTKSALWEKIESRLGRKEFERFFSHLYVIYFKRRPRRMLVTELRKEVIDKYSGEEFIDKVIDPYSKAYEQIIKPSQDVDTKVEQNIFNHLHWLNSVDNEDWLPPAIKFMADYESSPELIEKYFKQLERLVGVYQVCGKNMNDRGGRFFGLLHKLEGDSSESEIFKSVDLSSNEIKEALAALGGEIYRKGRVKRYRYIVQRLNAFLSDMPVRFNKNATIEHIMPQEVDPDSEWAKWWPDRDEREEWVNKLANLAILGKSKNSQASNHEFEQKKLIYIEGSKGVPSSALMMKLFHKKREIWDKDTLEELQTELIDVFVEHWGLKDELK